MNCLTDYIGLRGCTDSDPISGLYINDLAGISLKSIDAIADNEQHGHTAQHGQAQGGHALQGGVVESRGCSVLSNMNESSRFPQLGALHLHPRPPSRLEVHTAHFAVRKHLVPLHRGEVAAAVAHAASHITCTTAQRSSSVSSAPHPPTV